MLTKKPIAASSVRAMEKIGVVPSHESSPNPMRKNTPTVRAMSMPRSTESSVLGTRSSGRGELHRR